MYFGTGGVLIPSPAFSLTCVQCTAAALERSGAPQGLIEFQRGIEARDAYLAAHPVDPARFKGMKEAEVYERDLKLRRKFWPGLW